jgi:hypothetical protein
MEQQVAVSKKRYSDLTTKVSKEAMLREKLSKDDRWIARGLLTVYDHQTEDEQRSKETREHNGVGFTGIDGQILSNMADRLLRRGGRTAAHDLTKQFNLRSFLSEKEVAILRNKMPKYARQLLRLSENKKATNETTH